MEVNINERYCLASASRATGIHYNVLRRHIELGYLRAKEGLRNIRPKNKGEAPRKALVILGRDLQTYLNTYYTKR